MNLFKSTMVVTVGVLMPSLAGVLSGGNEIHKNCLAYTRPYNLPFDQAHEEESRRTLRDTASGCTGIMHLKYGGTV